MKQKAATNNSKHWLDTVMAAFYHFYILSTLTSNGHLISHLMVLLKFGLQYFEQMENPASYLFMLSSGSVGITSQISEWLVCLVSCDFSLHTFKLLWTKLLSSAEVWITRFSASLQKTCLCSWERYLISVGLSTLVHWVVVWEI